MDKWDWQREAEIQSYFSNGTEVHIAQEQDKLDSLIETFKQRSHENSDKNNVNNSFGENKKLDWLIIMDDVSGVADISKHFANFLTVSRKFGCNCVYFFTLLFLQVKFGKKLFRKPIYSIFYLQVFLKILFQKLFKVIVFYKVKNMFLHVRSGYLGFSVI